jgi:hypothetical protein
LTVYTGFYSLSHNTRGFGCGIRAQKGKSLRRGYNPASKNKGFDTPTVLGETAFQNGTKMV